MREDPDFYRLAKFGYGCILAAIMQNADLKGIHLRDTIVAWALPARTSQPGGCAMTSHPLAGTRTRLG